jgi:DNA-binding transcriptional ArsR family regulator
VFASDVDEVVIQRLVEGEPVEYTAFERRAAVGVLRQEGASINEIARRLGVLKRQVSRDVARLEEAS